MAASDRAQATSLGLSVSSPNTHPTKALLLLGSLFLNQKLIAKTAALAQKRHCHFV